MPEKDDQIIFDEKYTLDDEQRKKSLKNLEKLRKNSEKEKEKFLSNQTLPDGGRDASVEVLRQSALKEAWKNPQRTGRPAQASSPSANYDQAQPRQNKRKIQAISTDVKTEVLSPPQQKPISYDNFGDDNIRTLMDNYNGDFLRADEVDELLLGLGSDEQDSLDFAGVGASGSSVSSGSAVRFEYTGAGSAPQQLLPPSYSEDHQWGSSRLKQIANTTRLQQQNFLNRGGLDSIVPNGVPLAASYHHQQAQQLPAVLQRPAPVPLQQQYLGTPGVVPSGAPPRYPGPQGSQYQHQQLQPTPTMQYNYIQAHQHLSVHFPTTQVPRHPQLRYQTQYHQQAPNPYQLNFN